MLFPLEYEDVTHIDNTQRIDYSDLDCIEEVRQVLERRGKLHRFGVSLLHRHFSLSADETLVEICDPVSRVLTTRPVKKSVMTGLKTIETGWRFDGQPGRECVWDNDKGQHVSGGH